MPSTFSVFSRVQHCVSSSFAAAAASSFLRGFMVPEIRSLKSYEANLQHVHHKRRWDAAAESPPLVPAQRPLFHCRGRGVPLWPAGCLYGRDPQISIRPYPAAKAFRGRHSIGGSPWRFAIPPGDDKIKRSKKNDPLSWRSRSSPGYRVNMRPGPCSSGAAPLAG